MNGKLCVIYTTEEGGMFKLVVNATEDEYRDAVVTGTWDETPADWDAPRGTTTVPIKMIALLRVEENHDFVLGGSRDEPGTWHSRFRSLRDRSLRAA